MANPRTGIDFAEIDARRVTMLADVTTLPYTATSPGGSPHVGKAVSLSIARTVKLGALDEPFFGQLILVEADGKATVQYKGFMSIAGTLVLGAGVACAAAGAVKTGTRGFVVDATASPGWFVI